MLEAIEIKLKNKTSYNNFWNFLSKALIIKSNIEVFPKLLLIVENNKHLENFEKIFSFLQIENQVLDLSWDITSLMLGSKWFFLGTIELFKQSNINIDKIKNESLLIKSWENLNLGKFLENLLKLWYKFSEYDTKWKYNKKWDTITINSFCWNKKYKISLWWDRIEEIIEIKTKENTPPESQLQWSTTKSLREIYIWWGKKIEHKEKFNLENNSFLKLLNKENSIFTILDSLEFSEIYQELNKKLDNFCSLDFIKNPFLKERDLQIFLPKYQISKNLPSIWEKTKIKK